MQHYGTEPSVRGHVALPLDDDRTIRKIHGGPLLDQSSPLVNRLGLKRFSTKVSLNGAVLFRATYGGLGGGHRAAQASPKSRATRADPDAS